MFSLRRCLESLRKVFVPGLERSATSWQFRAWEPSKAARNIEDLLGDARKSKNIGTRLRLKRCLTERLNRRKFKVAGFGENPCASVTVSIVGRTRFAIPNDPGPDCRRSEAQRRIIPGRRGYRRGRRPMRPAQARRRTNAFWIGPPTSPSWPAGRVRGQWRLPAAGGDSLRPRDSASRAGSGGSPGASSCRRLRAVQFGRMASVGPGP